MYKLNFIKFKLPVLLVLLGMLFSNVLSSLAVAWKGPAAEWLANLGAVKMSRIDLAGFPAN